MSNPDPFDSAVELHQAGRLAEDEAFCRHILMREPNRPGPLLLLGVMPDRIVFADGLPREQYLARLARSPERLRAVRDKLAVNRATMPLFGMTGLARKVEGAYEPVWRRRGDGPAAFDVKMETRPR